MHALHTCRMLSFVTIVLLAGSVANAQTATTAPGRVTTSSSTERAEWAAIAHQLEASPLDEAVNHDAAVAVQQVTNSADFHVVLCFDFFQFFKDRDIASYLYHEQVYRLYMLGSAAYQVETGKTDVYGTALYGLDSVLKGYNAMLRIHPEVRSKKLDELVVTALSGKLPQFVTKKGCHD